MSATAPSLITASQKMTTPLSRTPIFVISPPLISIRSFKIQLRLRNPTSKPYPNHRFRISTTNSALSSVTSQPHISAHFGSERKSSSRRNYLREKILEKQQKVGSADVVDSNEKVIESVNVGNIFNGAIGCLSEEERLKLVGESEMLSKLESWADQYKKDVEFWGVGSSLIFTIFEDLDGNVEKVSVNEDEIRARGGLEEDLKEVNLRILHARLLAKELESGKSVVPRNSTVAKFVVLGKGGESSGVKGVKNVGKESDKTVSKELDDVQVKDDVMLKNAQIVESSEESDFVTAVRTAVSQPGLYPRLSKFGIVGLCGFLLLWALKSVFKVDQGDKLTIPEEGKTKGKMKLKKDDMVKVSVEVVDDSSQAQKVHIRRPKLDKQKLLKKMSKNKAPTNGSLQLQQSSSSEGTEIRKLDKTFWDTGNIISHNGETEENNSPLLVDSENLYAGVSNPKMVDAHVKEATTLLDFNDETSNKSKADFDGESTTLEELRVEKNINEINYVDCDAAETSSSVVDEVQNDSETMTEDDLSTKKPDEVLGFVQGKESCAVEALVQDGANHCTSPSSKVKLEPEQSASRKKVRIISSVKEARDYLSRKRDKQEPLHNCKDPEGSSLAVLPIKEPPEDHENIFSQGSTISDVKYEDDRFDGANVPQDAVPTQIGDGDSTEKNKENKPTKNMDRKHAATSDFDTLVENIAPSETIQALKPNFATEPPGPNDHWLEKNFHVLDPVVAKIRDGFRENYMVAQEKTEEAGTISDLSQLEPAEDDHELEWMKDDDLRDIVFKVRDNELSGREPFHLMSKEDEAAFFDGLQKKVEQENKKLLKVHEYIHSNVENLSYGADGISIYDPPEKVIPRWKGPPVQIAPKFLSEPTEQKDTMVNGNVKSPLSEKSRATSPLKTENGAARKPRTIIEGSDGSVKPGKKNGKEFWQHTKKWSRGFLELYNAETDPEVKAAMKDMGKDLDRWITEEEIQEAAEWIEKMPERNKDFIQKKVKKIKREMELFGPQAVVSKYKEYSDEKEEDYLWWLDLPYMMCIEMYTNEGEEQRVGFYSLDMATDLELEPKPCHVIAFEDAKDCKNMCYIIQAHLEMLGSGLAFVVARPPKDTFRESKANGFNVTVIRKGELSLNIDQMLEEVEERIVEIGSKMYHDQIMKDRGVDMNALMKGAIGDTKPIRRKRARRKSKNLTTNKQ